jgi:hypothetical protein
VPRASPRRSPAPRPSCCRRCPWDHRRHP